ncbi:hypothetical protein FRB90_012851 [Tulasnella sp. 427]|nr:hypothetical protein FRB90_012851 [Tulasnella sp. 427]
MAETRRVVAYGRKKQNFITVKRTSLLASPTSTPQRPNPEVIAIDDDSSYPPIEFVPEPKIVGKPSLSRGLETTRKPQMKKENAIQTGKARKYAKHTSINNNNGALAVVQSKQLSKPTKASPRRSSGMLPSSVLGKSPKTVRHPLAVKTAPQQIMNPVVNEIEIITIDSEGSEIRREERKPPPPVIDLCSPSGSSAPSRVGGRAKPNMAATRNKASQKKKTHARRIVSDESESEEDPIVFSPKKKLSGRQRKLVVVSDDEDEVLSPEKADHAVETPLISSPPVRPPEFAPSKVEGRPGRQITKIDPTSSFRLLRTGNQTLSSNSSTRKRVSEAVAPLPKDVIDSIARTGDLSAALDHLTPRTRRHLGEDASQSKHPARQPLTQARSSATQKLEGLTIGVERLALTEKTKPTRDQPSPNVASPSLKTLLKTCNQSTVINFNTFVSEFPRDALHGKQTRNLAFRKLGEASYSEVFAIGEVVLKVVPLVPEDGGGASHPQDCSAGEIPSSSPASDVNQEIVITREIGNLQSRFIKLIRAVVVQGAYPQLLLDLWDEYDEAKGSENVRPHTLPPSSLYAIIILPNHGIDLESYVFPARGGWKSAVSIWWQIARALGVAEDACQFEHRDLHWGQVLVQDSPEESGGVAASIIDFGLSRMVKPSGESVSTTFDSEIFDGKGDYQFDIYRMMKKHIGDDWAEFRPLTNVMWLHYLAVKLLKHKDLRRPAAVRGSSARTKPTPARLEREEERVYYETLVEIEAYLGKAIRSPVKQTKKTPTPEVGLPKSACDVLIWLAERTRGDDDD